MPTQHEIDTSLIASLARFATLCGYDTFHVPKSRKSMLSSDVELKANIYAIGEFDASLTSQNSFRHFTIAESIEELIKEQFLIRSGLCGSSILIVDNAIYGQVIEKTVKITDTCSIYAVASMGDLKEVVYTCSLNNLKNPRTLVLVNKSILSENKMNYPKLEAKLLSRNLFNTSEKNNFQDANVTMPPIKIYGKTDALVALFAIGADAKIAHAAINRLPPSIEVAIVHIQRIYPLPAKQLSKLLRQFRYSAFVTTPHDDIVNQIESQLSIGRLIQISVESGDSNCSDIVVKEVLNHFSYL